MVYYRFVGETHVLIQDFSKLLLRNVAKNWVFFAQNPWGLRGLVIMCCSAFNYLDRRVLTASTSRAVDLGLIPSRVKPMTLKLVFTASLLDAQH